MFSREGITLGSAVGVLPSRPLPAHVCTALVQCTCILETTVKQTAAACFPAAYLPHATVTLRWYNTPHGTLHWYNTRVYLKPRHTAHCTATPRTSRTRPPWAARRRRTGPRCSRPTAPPALSLREGPRPLVRISRVVSRCSRPTAPLIARERARNLRSRRAEGQRTAAGQENTQERRTAGADRRARGQRTSRDAGPHCQVRAQGPLRA